LADDTVQAQMEDSVRQLLGLSEPELEVELGRRLTQTQGELSRHAALSTAQPGGIRPDAEKLMAFPDVARKVAHRFLQNFNRQMYSLCCDSADPDHEKIRQAASAGAEKLGYVLGGIFVGTFGWLPGIATVLGVIVAKRFGGAAYDAVCSTWKEQL
jgi:hypothetical protein